MLLLILACTADPVDTKAAPADTEVAAVDTGDSPADTAEDSPADTAEDSPADTAEDSPADSPADTAVDSPAETAEDSPADTAVDSPADSPADTALDSAEDSAEVFDADADGYGVEVDCDDHSSAIHPGATEVCDGLDDDCDGSVDEGVGSTWYADADGDGDGDPSVGIEACDAPEGYVSSGTDCDDTNPAISPVASEVCDGIDDDCDGLVDDDDPVVSDSSRSVLYADADGDGYGYVSTWAERCFPGSGWVAGADDCDDGDAAVHPGQSEDCSTTADDDCDGATDAIDALACVTSYADGDGDGWGGTATCTCAAASDAPSGDCDDADNAVNPGAIETCNGVDDDCDGMTDAADSTVIGSTWYADADGDGYGDPANTATGCEPGAGYTSDGGDCDDTSAAVHPDATEVYGNEVDDDCDGEARPEACDDIYDQDTLPTFDLDFSDEDWAALEDDCYTGEQEYHPVTFTYDGETVEAQVRLKGNWTWTCGKYQFVVSFNEDDSDARFHGLRKLTLDSPWYDRTMLHERLAFPLFERLGLPYSCANNARVNVNGEYYGLYVNIERLDREYLERNFEDPDGNLYQAGSELETNEDEGDTSDLAALNAATTVEELAEVIDLDEATAEWAAEAMIPALDNYWAGVEINYYLYHYPDGKFLYLPYDLDLSFGTSVYGDGTPIWADTESADPITWEHTGWLKEPLFETVLADEAWCEVYVEKLREARAAYDPDEMAAQVYEWDAQIADAYDEDPRQVVTFAEHETYVAALVSYLQDRADAVDLWLAADGHCPAVF